MSLKDFVGALLIVLLFVAGPAAFLARVLYDSAKYPWQNHRDY